MNELAFITAPELTNYELSEDHPFKPIRTELSETLLRSCHALSDRELTDPEPLPANLLNAVHDPEYIRIVKSVSRGERNSSAYSHGLGTGDNPIFDGMHDAIEAVCAATTTALSLVASGEVRRAANLSRSEEHTSELQSRFDLVCRLLLEKK